MILRGSLCTLRPWRHADVTALTDSAGDPAIARYMSHRFPWPYSRSDAEEWIGGQLAQPEVRNWVIDVDGTLAGGIGLTPGTLERAGTVMIGYWLGKRFWGRGVATDALRTLTAHARATLQPHRLWANVMAANAASARVLEKAGYVREAVLARALLDRNGTLHDELVFVFGEG